MDIKISTCILNIFHINFIVRLKNITLPRNTMRDIKKKGKICFRS